jgi:hypothetical protein
MSKLKSHVHPGQYKVAGRERQGEDVVHELSKAKLARTRAAAKASRKDARKVAPAAQKKLVPAASRS